MFYTLRPWTTGTRPSLNLAAPTEQSGTSVSDSIIPGLRLKSLSNVTNVNAIKQSKPLDFSANVTVVYGKNGAGKSGFIRLMNNAFYSRGDRTSVNFKVGFPTAFFFRFMPPS